MVELLGIVADDLTGAADAAAPFASAGFATRLALREPGTLEGVEVVSVSTDSRSIDPAAAHERVLGVATRLRGLGVQRFYDKIDSTLRGNVVAELDALLNVVDDRTLAVVCPAFPAVGRTVLDGRLQIDGRPLLESASGRDPLAPAGTDRLDELLAPLGRVTAVPLSAVRSGAAPLADQLGRAPARIVHLDAVEEGDLTTVARACARLDRPVMGVGSGGLAAAIAEEQGVGRGVVPGRVLVVVGSRHPRSRDQLAELDRRPDVAVCGLDTESMDVVGAWESQVRSAFEGGPAVLGITTKLSDGAADPGRVASRLAAVTLDLTDAGIRTIVATGGDMAGAILDRAGGDSLEILGEIVAGLPISRVEGGTLAGAHIVTKSGGFGDSRLLSVAVDAARDHPEVRYP